MANDHDDDVDDDRAKEAEGLERRCPEGLHEVENGTKGEFRQAVKAAVPAGSVQACLCGAPRLNARPWQKRTSPR